MEGTMPVKKYYTEEERREARREQYRKYNNKRPRKGGPIGRPKATVTWWQKITKEEKSLLNRKYDLKKHYNMSLEEYDELLIKQNYCCSICKNPPDKKPLGVDHCHTTGKVRGLLCNSCNSTIGFCKDNITVLQNAIEYLQGVVNDPNMA